MHVPLLDVIAAEFVIAIGATLQASTGFGAGLLVVPLLALYKLEFVPGRVYLCQSQCLRTDDCSKAGRDYLMHLHTLTLGPIVGTLIGTVSRKMVRGQSS